MRTPMVRRVRALESEQGIGQVKDVRDMTDAQIYRALNVRDAAGALRTDLTDDELRAMLEQRQR